MNILAVDPGYTHSAFVLWDGATVLRHGKWPNGELFFQLRTWNTLDADTQLVIEMVACYGMAVGAEVFTTCLWIGRFMAAWEFAIGTEPILIYRRDIKMHFCASMRAKDSNVRQALVDRLGVPGTKKSPGITYGIKADEWQALALAVYAMDLGVDTGVDTGEKSG